MKIKYKLIYKLLLFSGLLVLYANSETFANDTITVDTVTLEVEQPDIIEEITVLPESSDTIFQNIWFEYPDYNPWEVSTIEGKLKMKGLPLSPNLKVYLKKDSLISMSLRAPFIGEAGRMDITPDSITIVNKIQKTFVKEGYKEGLAGLGYENLGIGEVQNLLLGRFFLPGIDIAEVELDDLVDVYYEEETQLFNVVPKSEAEIPDVKYGFVVDNYFNPQMLIVLPQQKPDAEADAIYTYSLKGYNIELKYQDSQRELSMILELKEPVWQGEAPKPLELSSKYKQVSIGELIK